MKTEQVVKTNVNSEPNELIYYDDEGNEKKLETLEELKFAVEASLDYLQEAIRRDLIDIWKRLDGIEGVTK